MNPYKPLTNTQHLQALQSFEEILQLYSISFDDLINSLYVVADWLEDTQNEDRLKEVLWKPDGTTTTETDIKNLYLHEYQSDWFDIDWDEMEDIDSAAEDF